MKHTGTRLVDKETGQIQAVETMTLTADSDTDLATLTVLDRAFREGAELSVTFADGTRRRIWTSDRVSLG